MPGEMTSTRPGTLGGSFILLFCSWIFRTWAGRRPKSRRNLLLVCTACLLYGIFVVTQAGNFFPHYKNPRRTDQADGDGVSEQHRNFLEQNTFYVENSQPLGGALNSSTTLQPNVVYITLRSKRSKPANIRGTVRPKKRRKFGVVGQHELGYRMQQDTGRLEDKHMKKYTHEGSPTQKAGDTGANILRDARGDNHQSNIRIYSDRAPPWFSDEDIRAMRFLADSRIQRITQLPSNQAFLMYENPSWKKPAPSTPFSGCQGICGLVRRPLDMSEVFAFHLDRILGLNRTLPSVSRKFEFAQDFLPCPVILWDSLLSPTDNITQSSIRLKWGSYQRILTHKCWLNGKVPKADVGCPEVHHHEWSKMALFDFLLQVYSRLDKHCCGFRPRKEDECVQQGLYLKCDNPSNIDLTHIVQRKHDPRNLVFVKNNGYFDRSEDNLDFKLLEGIKEFPESAVSVLKSHRLREKLLQSFFLDRIFWESQNGRQGIEKLIDVIERRAKILLTYINAHGIKVIPMND
ncbi:Golgi-associated kinase 1B [Ranitomeya imitator]|uniref:Golgi-associated kinase 1B n=1 Tax=Ranitomeya imitator TaxID=111125 RepID=UPI0037E8B51D